MRRSFLLLVLLPFFISCDRGFALFPLLVHLDDGSEVSRAEISLIERPGRSADEEGLLTPGGETLLELDRVVDLSASPAELMLRFSRLPEGTTVEVIDPDGGILLRAQPAAGFREIPSSWPVAAAIELPSAASIGALRFATTDRGSAARLEGIEVRSRRTGAGLVAADRPEGRRAYLFAAPGATIIAWDDGERFWRVDPFGAAGDPRAPIELRYRYTRSPNAAPEPETAGITAGGSNFVLDLRPGEQRLILYPEVEGIDVDEVIVESDAPGFELVWLGATAGDGVGVGVPRAIPVELGTLLRYDPGLWRQDDFELFAWTLYPKILLVDSLSYEVQSRFFLRLAFFVEKTGYRGRLLTDAELSGRHGYNAHNYNADGLADFFSAAAREDFPLNPEEERLREILLVHGIIRSVGNAFEPGAGGVLAVSQESLRTPTLRELLISHEAYHGVYYSEPEYVRAVDRAWESLDERQQRYWRLLLGGLSYDVDDDYLLRNEYHAYLLQQPVVEASWYFENRSRERLSRWYPHLQPWLSSYFLDYAGTHRDQAERLRTELLDLTGLTARDVYGLEPVGAK